MISLGMRHSGIFIYSYQSRGASRCIFLMSVLPNLALGSEVANASTSTAFMPKPCCEAGMAVKHAMLMAVFQEVQNATKSFVLVELLPHVIQVLYSSAKRPVR